MYMLIEIDSPKMTKRESMWTPRLIRDREYLEDIITLSGVQGYIGEPKKSQDSSLMSPR